MSIPILGKEGNGTQPPANPIQLFIESTEAKVMGIWMRGDQERLKQVLGVVVNHAHKQGKDMQTLLLVLAYLAFLSKEKELVVDMNKAGAETEGWAYESTVDAENIWRMRVFKQPIVSAPEPQDA